MLVSSITRVLLMALRTYVSVHSPGVCVCVRVCAHVHVRVCVCMYHRDLVCLIHGLVDP